MIENGSCLTNCLDHLDIYEIMAWSDYHIQQYYELAFFGEDGFDSAYLTSTFEEVLNGSEAKIQHSTLDTCATSDLSPSGWYIG